VKYVTGPKNEIRNINEICKMNEAYSLPFRWTGISRKGRVFPTVIPGVCPLKNRDEIRNIDEICNMSEMCAINEIEGGEDSWDPLIYRSFSASATYNQ